MDLDLEMKIMEPNKEDYLDNLLFGSHVEDILFECDGGLFPYIHEVFSDLGPGQVTRAMGWDECLDYMISECMIKNPLFGLYVLKDVELHYSVTWEGEGDCDVYFTELRPARWYEMRKVYSFWECIRRLPEQIKLHWLYVQGIPL